MNHLIYGPGRLFNAPKLRHVSSIMTFPFIYFAASVAL
jgi:hypothetical protein